jgi:hypothetical protein
MGKSFSLIAHAALIIFCALGPGRRTDDRHHAWMDGRRLHLCRRGRWWWQIWSSVYSAAIGKHIGIVYILHQRFDSSRFV